MFHVEHRRQPSALGRQLILLAAAGAASPPRKTAAMFHVEHCIGKNVRTRPFPKWEGVDSIGVAGASRQERLKGARRRL